VKVILAVAVLLSLVACSATPISADPFCELWVERTITYGDQRLKKVECVAWRFGPSAGEMKIWNRHHPAASQH
jgi:hypothetical protein